MLTKPIGTGILTTAAKRDVISYDALRPAIGWMTTLNDGAATSMLEAGAHAATDITGFGVLGHGGELARASGVRLAIDASSVPIMDHVLDLIRDDVVPSGTRNNVRTHATFTAFADSVDDALRVALSDAQTSGGLLISVARERAEASARTAMRSRRARCGDRRGHARRRHNRRVRAAIRSHGQYRWYALAVIMLGSTMGTLDASIANVALPTISGAYHRWSTTPSGSFFRSCW